jgi:phenylacetate-CoA ligase
MLIIRGVNIFPSDVEAIVRKDTELSGEYRLVVTRENHLDSLTVEAESRHGANIPVADLAARVKRQIKAVTGVGAAVDILPPDTLPRATHKAKRVEDRRTGVWTQ